MKAFKIAIVTMLAVLAVAGVAIGAQGYGWTDLQSTVKDFLTVGNFVRLGKFGIQATSTSEDVIHVDGVASQTGDCIEIDNSAGTALFKVEDDGRIVQSTDNADTSTLSSAALTRDDAAQAYIWRFYDESSTSTATTGKFTCPSATDGCTDKKNFGMYVVAQHPSSADIDGDSRDATLKVSYSNFGDNSSTQFRGSGIELNAANRAGGDLFELHGIDMIVQGIDGSNTSEADYIRGISMNIESAIDQGSPAALYGIDIEIETSVAQPTAMAGILVRNTGTYADAIDAALKVSDTGANNGFDYVVDAAGASIVTAELRGTNSETLDNKTNNLWAFSGSIKLPKVAADPCATLGAGTVFYTAGGLCYCNDNLTQMKVDGSSAGCGL
jgi:hypothetical protein